MNTPPQFSLARLHLWLLIAGLTCGFVLLLPSTARSRATGCIVMLLFLLADGAWQREWSNRRWVGFAYYSFAWAMVTFSMFITVNYLPEPEPPVQPMSILEAIHRLLFGHVLRDMFSELARAIAFVLMHGVIFLTMTFVSFIAAMPFCRRDSMARWLVVANIPGMLLVIFIVSRVLYDSLR